VEGVGTKVVLPRAETAVVAEGAGEEASGVPDWVAEQSCSVTVTVTTSRASRAEATTKEAVSGQC
jgi:hypothetical protein